jgi:hypothetical protein
MMSTFLVLLLPIGILAMVFGAATPGKKGAWIMLISIFVCLIGLGAYDHEVKEMHVRCSTK